MTATALSLEPAVAASPPSAQPAASYRDGPGVLRVDPRVIRKLAAAAADEVDGVSQASVGPIGRSIHHPIPPSTPTEQVSIDLDLTVSVEYPRSLRAAVERLAAHVSKRVEELAGRPVRSVSVHVQWLGTSDAPETPQRPRVR